MFFGSKSIPGLARTMGRTIHQIKEASSDIQSEIKKSTSEMKGDLNLQGLIKETTDDIKRPLDQMAVDLDNAVKYQPPTRKSHLEQKTEVPEARLLSRTETEKSIAEQKDLENQAPETV